MKVHAEKNKIKNSNGRAHGVKTAITHLCLLTEVKNKLKIF